MPPALRHRDFRLFWSGLVLSAVGTQFTTLAMAWQIYELTNSPLQIGLLGLARAVPQMSMLLFGGMLADALDRRRLLAYLQLGQLCISAALAGLSLSGLTSPLTLYIASGLLALFSAVENPARHALVPNLVPRTALASALALNSTQRTLGNIAGPTIAGLVLAFSSAGFCYLVDAVSWLFMLVALALIKARPQTTGRRGAVSFGALRDGLAFVWAHPIILIIILLDFSTMVLGNPRALLPVFARDILEVGAPGLGLLYAAGSVGSLTAGVIMSMIGQVPRAGLGVLLGIAVFGASTVAFGASTIFWLSALMLTISGAGDTMSAILRGTINQLITPDELRGRVISVNSLFTNGGPQLGQFRAGAAAEFWGTEFSAISGGVVTVLLVGGFLALPLIRRFELIPAPSQPGTSAAI